MKIVYKPIGPVVSDIALEKPVEFNSIRRMLEYVIKDYKKYGVVIQGKDRLYISYYGCDEEAGQDAYLIIAEIPNRDGWTIVGQCTIEED